MSKADKAEEAWKMLEAQIDTGTREQVKNTIKAAIDVAVRHRQKYLVSMTMNFILLVLLWI